MSVTPSPGQDTAAAARAAEYARQAGIPTIVDVENVRPGINELLRHIDAIIAAQGFPAALTGYDDPGRALEEMASAFAAPLVCVTLGEDGSLARCGGSEIRTKGLKGRLDRSRSHARVGSQEQQ